MRPVPLARRPLFDLPIAALKMLDDGAGDLALLVFGKRSAHPADEAEMAARRTGPMRPCRTSTFRCSIVCRARPPRPRHRRRAPHSRGRKALRRRAESSRPSGLAAARRHRIAWCRHRASAGNRRAGESRFPPGGRLRSRKRCAPNFQGLLSKDAKAHEIYPDAKAFVRAVLAGPPPPDHIAARRARRM